MAVVVTHTFVSGKADGGDTSLVQPSNWNANHTLSMGTGKLVGRTTAGTGALEEITVGTGLTLSALTLSLNTSGKFVTQAMLGADSVGAPEIIAGAVGTTELAAAGVTNAKLAFDAGPLSGFRNRLINGDFRVAQRPAGTYADDTYGVADRWYVLTQTGVITPSVLTDPENGSPFALRLNQDQATAQRMGTAQIIEGVNCKELRSQAVVLSGRVRCSAATTIRYAILEWTGTVDVVTSDVVNNWASTTYTPGNFFNATTLAVVASGSLAVSANTWTQLTDITGTPSASMNNLIVIVWTDSTQAQNVTLDLAQMQLEQGAVRTVFERRPIATELPLCQRYYEREASAQIHGFPCPSSGGFAHTFQYFFKALKRTSSPSVTMNYSSNSNVTSQNLSTSNASMFTHQVVGSSAANASCYIQPVIDAEL